MLIYFIIAIEEFSFPAQVDFELLLYLSLMKDQRSFVFLSYKLLPLSAASFLLVESAFH